MVGRGWMSGALIEETLELWAASLREVKGRMRPLFTQDRAAAGDPGAGLLGWRWVARHCARVRGRDACRTECRPGGGRDRFSEAGQGLVRRGSAVHRLCGTTHK